MRTRFAPSPTGFLHLGHAFSALTAWDMARAAEGELLLRIEDIDGSRSRHEYEQAIFGDLRWLGLRWRESVMRQSERALAYGEALKRLSRLGLTYPCTCSRRDIAAALNAPQEGAAGVDGPVYPGTCRGRTDDPPASAIRLDLGRALAYLGEGPLTYRETGPDHYGEHLVDRARMLRSVGDFVLARRDIGTSYHLAVVVDDAAQGITHVVRGEDLVACTVIHRLLQALLDLPVPDWHHHRLIRDENGKRLAKRDAARAISHYRAEGRSPSDIRRMVGLLEG